jgi:hypothetical protein
MTLVELRCRCGALRGTVDFSRPSLVRIVCHCGDCARYARQIGDERATQIVQATPDQLTIVAGREHLRCLRLTERGLTRWFAGCCRTPLANTSRYRWLPFVGVMTCVLATDDDALLGREKHANGSYPTPWGTVVRSVWWLLLGLLFRRHRPSAFFDDKGRLTAQPERLS